MFGMFLKVIAALLLFAALGVRGEEKPPPMKRVEGFVVDAKNALQPAIDIAPSWIFTGGQAVPEGKTGFQTDAKGHFAKDLPWRGPVTLLAMDAKREKGSVFTVTQEQLGKPVTVRLQPLVRVKARLECRLPEIEIKDAWLSVEVAGGPKIGGAQVSAGELSLRLPAGTWKLKLWHANAKSFETELVVPASKPEFDAGPFTMEPTLIATCEGRELPAWRIQDARGAPKTAQLSDWRGKWVLLEFWRSGCPSCRGWIIPGLRDFRKKYADQSGRFEIVAFGEASHATFAEMDAYLDKETKGDWNTAGLPFPVLMDAKDKGTIAEWGITTPKQLLIDPEGKVVKGGSLEMLEKILREGK